jgi:hypothetical protein
MASLVEIPVSSPEQNRQCTAPVRAPWENDPYRLISWWDMEQFSAAEFYSIAENLGILIQNARFDSDRNISTKLSEEQRQSFGLLLDGVLDKCEKLRLKVSVEAARDAIRSIKWEHAVFNELGPAIEEVSNTIRREMRTRYFLSLTTDEAERYNEWDAEWKPVITRFGETMRDVEEMQKCFALARYSASMFHALHVAEWGAIHLGKFIGVTDQRPGWGPTERKLRELIRVGHSAATGSLKGKFDLLEQMHREIDSMVLAWRHKVDHAANHLAILPNAEFTPEVAKHIIESVKVFMQRLIDGIPESQ